MQIDFNTIFEKRMQRILSGPQFPENEFIASGATYGDVYRMAAAILDACAEHVPVDRPVCLCGENKAFIAAAVLARLAGGPPLVLPFSSTRNVLRDTFNATGFQAILAPAPIENPLATRMKVMTPELLTSS